MSKPLRWMVTALVGVIALTGAASFAPRALPAAAPPVRLEGTVTATTVPAPTELVVVPTPSVDLETTFPVVTSTTLPTVREGAPATATVPTVPALSGDDDDEPDDGSDDDDSDDGSDDDDSDDGSDDDDSADSPDED